MKHLRGPACALAMASPMAAPVHAATQTADFASEVTDAPATFANLLMTVVTGTFS